MPVTRSLSGRFVQTLEKTLDSVVIIDSDNCVVLFNRAVERLWGFQHEEVLGNNVSMLVPESIRSRHDGYIDSNRHALVTKRAAADLTIELTEHLLLDTHPGTIQVLHDLNAQGIRLAMDDFGTGYSSLSYLRHLPIQALKLDRSFVLDLEADGTSRALSEAVMRIGDSLRLKVVAEGVEEHGQYRILKDQGYHVAQGYLLSKPLTPQDLEAWMMKY